MELSEFTYIVFKILIGTGSILLIGTIAFLITYLYQEKTYIYERMSSVFMDLVKIVFLIYLFYIIGDFICEKLF